VIHLPTHREHFYDVHRLEFSSAIEVETDNSPHVLNLVAGTSVVVEVGASSRAYRAAETFVVPAAAGRYRLVNQGEGEARVVKAFLKADFPYW
jgi:hypothetical protein